MTEQSDSEDLTRINQSGPGIGISRKILYACNDGFYFAQHRAHVARRLLREGWTVELASGGDITTIPPDIAVKPIEVDRLSFSPIRDFRLMTQIRAAVRADKPDVVHLITMKLIVFGALALLSLRDADRPRRVVATFPGLGRVFEADGMMGRLSRTLVLGVLRRLMNRLRATATFENARDVETLAAHGVAVRGRAVVMRGAGLDLKRFAGGPRSARRPLRVLWASRLIHGKGAAAFIDAALLARNAVGSAVEFLVAGYRDPGHADNLTDAEIRQLEAEPAVTFLGHVKDMPGLLREVDLFVLTSRYNEGLPRALIESSAAGIPAITSDNAGCRAVVIDGQTGTILPEISGVAIWHAVRTYLDDEGLLFRQGKAAADFVRAEGFSEEAVQEAFLSVYLQE